MAFEDETLTAQEKAQVLLSNLYPKTPHNADEALKQALQFLNGGDPSHSEQDDSDPQPRLYSFKKDANFIFAAFRQTHGIDLTKASLHWFEFLALFMDLGSETTFCQLINLRRRVKTGKATKEERKAAQDMGDVFNLPDADTRTLEEKIAEADFMKLMSSD